MKKIIFAVAVVASLCLTTNVNAQCPGGVCPVQTRVVGGFNTVRYVPQTVYVSPAPVVQLVQPRAVKIRKVKVKRGFFGLFSGCGCK